MGTRKMIYTDNEITKRGMMTENMLVQRNVCSKMERTHLDVDVEGLQSFNRLSFKDESTKIDKNEMVWKIMQEE